MMHELLCLKPYHLPDKLASIDGFGLWLAEWARRTRAALVGWSLVGKVRNQFGDQNFVGGRWPVRPFRESKAHSYVLAKWWSV